MNSDQILAVINTVSKLRAPDGCPWDREQTHQSLKPFLIEEVYETIEAIDEVSSSPELLKEELGDVLLQILLHSQIASETNCFDFSDVCESLDKKLKFRHPHVFSNTVVKSSVEVDEVWKKQKEIEKGKKESVLDGIPKGLPPLHRTMKFLKRVTRVGFQWNDLDGPLDKVDEEVSELRAAAKEFDAEPSAENRKNLQLEIGDALFTVSNIGFLTGNDPEEALQSALKKFETRFRYMEKKVIGSGKKLENTPLSEMDKYWNEAKTKER